MHCVEEGQPMDAEPEDYRKNDNWAVIISWMELLTGSGEVEGGAGFYYWWPPEMLKYRLLHEDVSGTAHGVFADPTSISTQCAFRELLEVWYRPLLTPKAWSFFEAALRLGPDRLSYEGIKEHPYCSGPMDP